MGRWASLATVATVGLLSVVWLVWPGNPPVYDGLPLDVPPYQYLDPPSGISPTGPPSHITDVVQVAGTPYGFAVHTDEIDPQAAVVIPIRSLSLPPGVNSLAVTIVPVQPPLAHLPDGRLDGNVYRVSVAQASSGEPVALRAGASFTITLRHTGAPGVPYLAQYFQGGWRKLSSFEPAAGQSQSTAHAFGEFALALVPRQRGMPSDGVLKAVAVAGALAAIGIVLFVVRRQQGSRVKRS
jgi:hypothetical protein